MLPFEHDGRQAVFDLLYSGVGDQIQPGDTVGVWNFGREVHGGIFPMQVWAPEQNLQLASSVGLFLKTQAYENQAQIERVIPKLLSLIGAVKDVNILIVSSSDSAWKGTSFERDINLAYQKNAVESRNAKRPLITTLVARNGAISSWSVTLAGEPVALPKPVPADKMVQTRGGPQPNAETQSGASETSIPLAGQEPKTAHPPRAPAIQSLIITSKGTKINGEPREDNVLTSVVLKEPVASGTELKPGGAPPAPKAEAKSSKEGSLENNNLTVAQPPLPAKSGVSSIPIPAFAPLPILAREKTVQENVTAPASTPPPLAMSSPPKPLFTSRGLFLMGGALTVLAAGFLYFARRFFRPAAKPSFISRSFDRDKP